MLCVTGANPAGKSGVVYRVGSDFQAVGSAGGEGQTC